MPPSPHDALFKSAFAQPDIARSELELVLPAALLAHLDLATLATVPGSFIDDELRHAHTDLLYSVRTTAGGEALVYILFEHQSSFDALMPLRLLRYVMRIWDRWLRDHPDTTTIPIVVPVLLHHGPSSWQAAPSLESMFDASPGLLEAARPFLPLFRFVLDDLAGLSLDVLSSRTLHAMARLVQLAFWSSRSLERLLRAAPFMRAITVTLSRDQRTRALLEQLYVYLLRATQPEVEVETVRTILLQVAGPHGQEDVMNAGEQLIEQGRLKGLEQACEALRAATVEALSSRALPLSDVGRARLAACSDLAVLRAWLVRAITASSEAEVFATDDAL